MTQPLARSPGGLELGYLALPAGRLVQNAVDEAAAAARMPALDLQAFAPLTPGSAVALAALLGEVVEPWLAEVTGRRAVPRDDPA